MSLPLLLCGSSVKQDGARQGMCLSIVSTCATLREKLGKILCRLDPITNCVLKLFFRNIVSGGPSIVRKPGASNLELINSLKVSFQDAQLDYADEIENLNVNVNGTTTTTTTTNCT